MAGTVPVRQGEVWHVMVRQAYKVRRAEDGSGEAWRVTARQVRLSKDGYVRSGEAAHGKAGMA